MRPYRISARSIDTGSADERAVVIDCEGERLLGIMHQGEPRSDIGVVIVVGGPQYRVGSHRQFVLMARHIAAAGIPVLRFDYRGMGDSEGRPRSFEAVDADIEASVDTLISETPDLKGVVLLGLCDAASAILMYLPSDPRITGVVILNPWVHSESGEARAYLRHYYFQRLLQRAFWAKVFSGRFEFWKSARDAAKKAKLARGRHPGMPRLRDNTCTFVDRMRLGLDGFVGGVLTFISGRDITAAQFFDLLAKDQEWRKLADRPNFDLRRLESADHTLSSRSDLDSVCKAIVSWLQSR